MQGANQGKWKDLNTAREIRQKITDRLDLEASDRRWSEDLNTERHRRLDNAEGKEAA